MLSRGPPFGGATPTDNYYRSLLQKSDLFWKLHSKNKPTADGQEYYSAEFKDLIGNMLALDPNKRISID